MNMTEILDVAISFFQQDDWPITESDGQPFLRTAFQGANGHWSCYAQSREEQSQFIFYSVCPVNVPEGRRLTASEFLTRANYDLVIGNFEMDWQDGEIRYKSSIDVLGDRLTPALVKQLVYTNVLMMDRYLPGIMEVVYGNVLPAEALAKIDD
jgi:hypothetical protein